MLTYIRTQPQPRTYTYNYNVFYPELGFAGGLLGRVSLLCSPINQVRITANRLLLLLPTAVHTSIDTRPHPTAQPCISTRTRVTREKLRSKRERATRAKRAVARAPRHTTHTTGTGPRRPALTCWPWCAPQAGCAPRPLHSPARRCGARAGAAAGRRGGPTRRHPARRAPPRPQAASAARCC